MTYNEFREMRGIPIPAEEAAAEISIAGEEAVAETDALNAEPAGDAGAESEQKRKGK